MFHKLSYSNYVNSKYFDINDFVIAETGSYRRCMRVSDMCAEMDELPQWIRFTDVLFGD